MIQAMDSKQFVIKKEKFGTDINIPNIKEVIFLGNSEIIAYQATGAAFIIDLFHNEISGALNHYVKNSRWRLCSDQSKTRAMFSSEDLSGVVVYDSLSKKIKSKDFPLTLLRDNKWNTCFDESKPTSILCSGIMNRIISGDYMSEKINSEIFISQLYNNDEFKSHQYVFDSLSQSTAIISAFYGGFRIDYESESHPHKNYPIESSSSCKNYVCSSDISFIAHYSDMAQDVIVSPYAVNEEMYRKALIPTSGCCITNIKTGDNTYLNHDKGVRIAPCSIEFHPNNEVLVTMSAGSRIIEYWQAATGQLLARQQLPIYYAGKFINEVGRLYKYLSFSANGTLLAAAFPTEDGLSDKIVVCDVPFEAQCGITKDRLIWMLWWLRNHQHDGNLLPKDIVRLLLHSFKFA